VKLRIHHFFDIIRDFGRKVELKPHPYGHSYHKVAKAIWNYPYLKIRIVAESDDICVGCIHLKDNSCDDLISFRKDFRHKEKFNDFIDRKIMKACLINNDEVLNPVQLCTKTRLYLANILWIYDGNDLEHTLSRKESIIRGLKEYSEKHGLDLT